MKKRFYRIRNLDSLLDKYKELENQEIFFQSTEKLNDPMEGFMDFIFKGDEVVWKNLIIHFIFCFSKVNLIYKVIGEKVRLDNKIIPIFELIDVDKKQFFFNLLSDINKNKFYEFINKDSISRNELESFLKTINHSFFADFVSSESKIFKSDNSQNIQFLLNFYSHYLEVIEQFTYPKYYVASFLEEHYNSSVWGHYGQGHSGVCLIFETNNKEEIPFLNVICGSIYNSNSKEFENLYSDQKLKLRKVNYCGDFEEINFFESLGRISEPLANSFYVDENKNKSILFDKVLNNQEEWEKSFWDKYENNKLIKTKDWAYEKEYRIVFNRLIDYEIEEKYRKLKYDFSCLKGVIFGIKTPQIKKDEIIRIIKNKCYQNNILDFEFYQAYFCKEENTIKNRRLAIDIKKELLERYLEDKINLKVELICFNAKKENLNNKINEIDKIIERLKDERIK
ncbi:DUF2971 domain-containing protein [Aliarcobacter butzleri]|uniref:DUF2971 domain-containing protein n=1 Tax=Aliarcobacter butzleri TaxID=28197 RepID=A0AAP4PAM0_9BACT|nr:DUF2971 domain-containing protein [Aliarcobacter butzleri]MDN5052458.1 DUF2971 domain-containing protein [Aliarcobacter butzleri]MDN5060879.1 DUF2971 domain-containing protein [Aliarcobacter butzleri]MDN5075030.1 DUF2971 domain-containing protein [Aliarcobacter butzleri]MDN5116638.1 DUF2971 domain-containing protein [Aliarcobacter butzleri]MDN5132668.1 DUF2971 domain-containing protein [Aliarcobacter butzleri]